jgi:NAD(P)H-dependent FMN reductase
MISLTHKIKLTVVLGTGRKGRFSERVFGFITQEISKDPRFEVTKVDVRDFIFGVTDDTGESHMAKNWKDIVLPSDAILFVSPEYNRSYPGELKMLLDSLFDEYDKKLVGVCSVSSGGFGGVRMAEKLKSLFVVFNMRILKNDLAISSVAKEFNENDVPINRELYSNKIKTLLDEIVDSV